MNKAKFDKLSGHEKAVIIALGVLDGQRATLHDSEGVTWESSAETRDDISIMTITRKGEVWYKEVYNHELGESQEFFY